MKKIETTWIIDDDRIFIFGLKKKLEQLNFTSRIEISHNGEEALHRLQKILAAGEEKIPDLILLDQNMPILDGWQFLKEYQEIRISKKIIIFMLTSSIDPADVQKAKSNNLLGGYYIKPLRTAELEEIKIQYYRQRNNKDKLNY